MSNFLPTCASRGLPIPPPQQTIDRCINILFQTWIMLYPLDKSQSRGAYHLTENVGNSGWKVNGKVTFRKFQPKIEEYVLR